MKDSRRVNSNAEQIHYCWKSTIEEIKLKKKKKSQSHENKDHLKNVQNIEEFPGKGIQYKERCKSCRIRQKSQMTVSRDLD